MNQINKIIEQKVINYHKDFAKKDKWNNLYFRIKQKILNKYLNKNYNVLDIGIGHWNHALQISDKVRFIYWIDISPDMIKILKDKIEKNNINNIKIILGNILDTNIVKGLKDRIDLVYSFSTLYYIDDIDKLLSNLYLIWHSKTIYILEFVNKYSFTYYFSKKFFDIPQFGYSKRFLMYKFKNKGFKILKIYYFDLIPFLFRKKLIEKILSLNLFWHYLDELLSSIPVINFFSGKFIFILKKK